MQKDSTVIDTWTDIFPFLVNAPWHKIFTRIHKISPEPYLHSFQYKIVNRILNCGTNLHKWKLNDMPECAYCNTTATIEHHLFLCVNTRLFWDKTANWFSEIFEIETYEDPTVCKVLFGTAIEENKST